MDNSVSLEGKVATRQSPPINGMLFFYLICVGQIVSIIGSGLTGFAVRVWAYERTGLATQFGLIALCYTLPGLLVLPVTGVLVDRYDKRLLMFLSDIGSACGTFAIWFLFTRGQLEIWHIYLAVSCMSAFGSLRWPAYTATTPILVPKEQLGRANGLVQFGGAASQTLAPILAGVLLASIGLRGITLIDLGTFVFALLTLLVIRLPRPEVTAQTTERRQTSFIQDSIYGWRYIQERPGLLGLLLISMVITGSERMVIVLIAPLVLGFADAKVLGVVSSIAGVGMILGAVTMTIWGGPRRRIHGVLGFTLLRAFLLLLGGLQPSALLIGIVASLFLFLAQIGGGCTQALWQTKVAPDVRGRVFATLHLVNGAISSLALVLAGTLADNVFQPLLDPGGSLAGSVGQIIGVGPGRGIGLIFIVLGILNTLIVVAGYLSTHIRRVEIELPDAVGDHVPVTNSQQITGNRISNNRTGETKMKRIRRWLTRILLGVLALAVILSLVGTWSVRRTWPTTDGTIAVAGLLAPVKVIRDQWGIPHIYAANEHDLFFTQGYVHAQDRLWQMEINRRTGSGTLSEIFGKAALKSDLALRKIGLRRAAEKVLGETSPENLTILQAYADGVNAFTDTHRDRLPVEFTILGVNPAPWTPLDSLSYGNVLAADLSGNYLLELLRAKMIAKVGEEVTQQLFPPAVVGTPIIIPDGVNGYSGLRDAQFSELTSLNDWVGLPDPGLGSNDWVVSGSRTASGKPLLANDTHLGMSMPSIWYEVDLHGGRFNVAGVGFPGVPLIILGHNDHIAWGTSNLGNDVQDSYLEKVNDPKNPTQYEFKGQWHDLKVVPEKFIVKGSDPFETKILITQHGPIMNADKLETEAPLAMRWTLQDGNHLFDSVIRINLASNWSEFHEALRLWDVPGQNFVYADVDGNIGYHSSGKTPIRVAGHLGTVPVPGWTGEYEWQGYIPFEAMPKVLNPPAGFVATANNKITPDDYPYVLARDWYPGFRAQRITEMLSASDKLTIEDMHKIQADTKLLPAGILRPYLLAVQPENDLQAQAMAQVKDWDLRLEANSVGGAVYEVWFASMVKNTIGDELGSDLLTTYLAGGYQRHSSQVAPLMINLMSDPANTLFDDKNTPQVEKRDDIILRSLRDAVALLSEQCGGTVAGWQWGRIHTVTFQHQPFKTVPVLKMFFNGPTLPARGDRFTVDAAAFNASQTFVMVHGSSQRLIVDLSNLNNSLSILTTGQSELVFHPHRFDMVQKWQNVEYVPLLYTQGSAQANSEGVLMLVPPESE